MAVIRLVAYLAAVAATGMIAQGAVGGALHGVLWSTREHAAPGAARIVTETTTMRGETIERTGAPGETMRAPATTTVLTVPGPTTTATVSGAAVTTTVPGKTETVSAPGLTVTTTVPGPATTTTVPGPATTTTVPGPARTTTVPGPVVTTTVPGPTETVTVTVSTGCDPPPKRPSDPPCPPHK